MRPIELFCLSRLQPDIFGDMDPIGQSIYWRGTRELMVTGVFKDFPENSHMKFELITSLEIMEWL